MRTTFLIKLAEFYRSRTALRPRVFDPRRLSVVPASSGPACQRLRPIVSFSTRSVIVSNLVISHPPDIFHPLLAHLIPFFLEMRPTVSTFSVTAPVAPRTTHAGSLGISVCRQRVSLDRTAFCSPFLSTRTRTINFFPFS